MLTEGKDSQIEGLIAKDEDRGMAAARASRGRKPEPVAVAALDETLLEDDPQTMPESDSNGEQPSADDEQPGADGDQPAEKPKKKTRRGSRGGRGRKKKAPVVADDGTTADGGATAPVEVEAVAEIQEPSANGDAPAEEKPKKKTRRGSRGGRRRKKKPAGDTAAADTPAEPIATLEDAG